MKPFLTIFLIGSCLLGFSQNLSKSEIDSITASIDSSLSKCNIDPEYCGYYQNTVEVNKGNGSWRAVGNYNKKISFWYNEDPQMAEALEIDPADVLSKIIVSVKSTYVITEEIYLLNGEVIKVRHYTDDVLGESSTILYYVKEKLEYLERPIVADSPEVIDYDLLAQKCLDDAKSLIALFLQSFAGP